MHVPTGGCGCDVRIIGTGTHSSAEPVPVTHQLRAVNRNNAKLPGSIPAPAQTEEYEWRHAGETMLNRPKW